MARQHEPPSPTPQSPAPACPHDCRHEAVTDDGEVVCRICGVVKEEPAHVLLPPVDQSRTNLYLETEVGGKPDSRGLPASRFVRGSPDLAAVSNIAQALQIPNHVSRDVWTWYRRLRRARGLSLTKAKTMVLAFHGVCRCHGCPLDEQRLLEAIRVHLRVKNAHPYLRVVMEASSYMDDDSQEMILRRMGFFDLDPGRRQRFAISSQIRPLAEAYAPEVAEGVAEVARSVLQTILDDNPARAARTAMRIAKRRCGVP